MSSSLVNNYINTAESLEAVEEVYRSFADSTEEFDHEFNIEYDIEEGIINFRYFDDSEDKTITVGSFDGVLMLEGMAFRETPRGEEVAHKPCCYVDREMLEGEKDQLKNSIKTVYKSLKDPDNWQPLPENLY